MMGWMVSAASESGSGCVSCLLQACGCIRISKALPEAHNIPRQAYGAQGNDGSRWVGVECHPEVVSISHCRYSKGKVPGRVYNKQSFLVRHCNVLYTCNDTISLHLSILMIIISLECTFGRICTAVYKTLYNRPAYGLDHQPLQCVWT